MVSNWQQHSIQSETVKKKVAFWILFCEIATVNEINSENLRSARALKNLNQEDVGELLGLTKSAVSKIENGGRNLTETEKQILEWHLLGKVPERISSFQSTDIQGALEFSEAEWHIIGVLAARAGQTPGKWIAAQIRAYLAFSAAADEADASAREKGTA